MDCQTPSVTEPKRELAAKPTEGERGTIERIRACYRSSKEAFVADGTDGSFHHFAVPLPPVAPLRYLPEGGLGSVTLGV